mmetsp:Transcript_42591/g.86109  ORF Transcript_42591/g.86109 Transcript_42591/m.86109 type:complete len:166 (-) Transcript_42591:284-781(-)
MSQARLLYSILLIVAAFSSPLDDVAFDGPPGWRMVDRFAGFRYEVSGHVIGVGFRRALAATAEELGCFGWAQNTAHGTVVGEARCAKVMAPQMKEWVRTGPSGAKVEDVVFRDYDNTKIKLHFSHFKILPDDRETCFRDLPHQCLIFKQQPTTPETDNSSPKAEL